MKKSNRGPVHVLCAAILWSMAGVCTKYIPWNPISIACVRGGIAGITIGCFRRKWTVTLNRPTVIAAVCMSATTVLFMISNKLTTAANAVVLQYTAPIYVIIMIIVLLRTKPKAIDIITVLLAICGITLFFLDHLGHGALMGDCIALLSGVTFSGVFFFNSLPEVDPMESCYLGCCISALLMPALFFDGALISAGPVPWLLAVFLGVFQLGLAYLVFAKGIQSTGAVTSSIICAIEPILNPIWVFLAVGERPGTLAVAGAVLVIITIVGYNVVKAKERAAAVEAME